MSAVSELNEIEARAIERFQKILKSARSQVRFNRYAVDQNLASQLEEVFEDDLDRVYDLVDDDMERLTALWELIVKKSQAGK